MSDFIQGDNFNRPGGDAEEIVWKAIKSALRGREILGYSRYPLFRSEGGKRKEPDIVLLDKEFGLIVIEVKGIYINDIESVVPNRWTLKNSYNRTINPIAQSEDYLFALKGKFDIERELRGKYYGKAFVALPYINKKEFIKKGFLDNLSEEVFIFKDDLIDKNILDKFDESQGIVEGQKISDDNYRLAKSILGYEQIHTYDIDYDISSGSKADIYNSVKAKLYDLDIQQEIISKTIVDGPQRIRGIAGSGKTLLICQKAAYMHLKHPTWKIAITFFTQSLYDTIIQTLDMYIKAFTRGEQGYNLNSNLMVLHAWGRKDRNGIYKEICERNNCTFLNANDVKKELGKYVSSEVSMNYISYKLLEESKGNLEQIFDAIFIDEGQDLVGDDEYKYEQKQSFYYMLYKSLRSVENDAGKDLRRLVWAYDELQSLNDAKIPSSKEIFGDSSLVKGSYKGGIKKSEIMKKCYRTPHQILTVAHALGMGFFREDGMLSGYTTKRDWNNIGYNVVDGDFRKEGNKIILERPIENSPNPMNEFFDGDTFEFKSYSSEHDLMEELANNIEDDIKNQKLNICRDILIINLKNFDKQFLQEVGESLNRRNIDFYIPGCGSTNKFKEDDFRKNKPDKFWEEDAVTISTITKAKGNEAAMVYVIGVDEIAKNEGEISYRNKLFTALTRAKCWVKLMGTGDYSLYSEIKKALSSNGRFEFIYKKPKKESNDNEIE